MFFFPGTQIDLKEFTRKEFHEYFQHYVSDPIMDPTPFVYQRKNVDHGYDLLSQKHRSYRVLGIFLKDGTPIGDLSYRNFNLSDHSCIIGIALGNDSYKGHGYGTEAFGLGIQIAFYDFHLQSLYGDTLSCNTRMQHIFETYHFIKTETFKSFTKRNGVWVDRYSYVLNRPVSS